MRSSMLRRREGESSLGQGQGREVVVPDSSVPTNAKSTSGSPDSNDSKSSQSKAPKVTKSMRIAVKDLVLRHLWVIYPGQHSYPVDEQISVWPIQLISELLSQLT